LLQQDESRTNVATAFDEEERQEKEPIMSSVLKNIAALVAVTVGALIGSVGTSDAQNYRYYNNAYGSGPAYNGAYRSHRAMAPMPSQRAYYTNSFDKNQSCWQSPASLEYTGGCY
jgi:hypothetical protein